MLAAIWQHQDEASDWWLQSRFESSFGQTERSL